MVSTDLAAGERLLEVHDLGLVDYAAATRLQETQVDACLRGAPDRLFLLEHPSVFTMGRAADARHLGTAGRTGIPVVRSARGGQVTYHGPGQLVAYPVLDLARHVRDVRAYVGSLEEVVIRTVATWGARGLRIQGQPGVWVGSRKIASVGIAIRRWVAWHGLALNVDPEMGPFRAITPCGLAGVEMTSLAAEGVGVRMADVRRALVRSFVEVFAYEAVRYGGDDAGQAWGCA